MPKKRNSVKASTNKRPTKKDVRASRIKKEVQIFKRNFPLLSLRTKSFIILGFLFLSISLIWHLNQTIQLAFFTPHVTPLKNISALPTQLIIQKIKMTLPIEETAINNGMWQVSQNGASHLTISARPGEKGPIILYGHNTIDRLGPIRWLSKGDTIEIKTADGKIHTYIIEQTMTIAPDKMDIFTQRKGETFILYTCDGFADLQRFVLIASPK